MVWNSDQSERKLARNALRRAVEGEEPELSRLLENTPKMMAEARRRRVSGRSDFFAELAALADRIVPRLAAATGLLILLSTAIHLSDRSSGEAAPDFRSLILATEAARSDDLILKAIAATENDNG